MLFRRRLDQHGRPTRPVEILLHVGGRKQRSARRPHGQRNGTLDARLDDLAVSPVIASCHRGSLAKTSTSLNGTFPTHTPLFVGLLVGIILILGGLQFFPALALGPIAEHFSMLAGQTF